MFIEPNQAMVICGFISEEKQKQYAILLHKSMYGNMDTTIKLFKTLCKHLTDSKNMKITQSLFPVCKLQTLQDDKACLSHSTLTNCGSWPGPCRIESKNKSN